MQRPQVGFDPTEVAGHRIVLVGFMGSGKTTLAQHWAQAGGPALWFDSDRAALRRLGLDSVTEAFARGEQQFRSVEREVIVERSQLLSLGLELWSLGGGAVLDADVQRTLFGSTVIWLDASEDVLWERVRGSDRPLARERETFHRLYEERRETYSLLATARVDTSDGEPTTLPGMLRGIIPATWLDAQVSVARGLLERIDEVAMLGSDGVAIVADQAVAPAAARAREQLVEAGIAVAAVDLLPCGEWHKQLATVERLLRSWSAAGLTRRSVVVAIGGGTLLDMAGFAASVYQRGIRWVSVPTTVTAQVDAGIGGKTGVNMGAVKNVVGAVHFPSLVMVDPGTLVTLPPRVAADGMVEAVKTALLAGDPLQELVTRAAAAADRDGDAWEALVAHCAAYKDAVVREDPDDTTGVRAQLNLGHTVGHAVEAATGGAIGHGQAVALGMRVTLRLSQAELGLDASVVAWLDETLEAIGVELTSDVPWERLEPFLVHDKKRTAAGIGWVLLQAPGTPVTEAVLDVKLAQAAWEQEVYRPGGASGSAAVAGDGASRRVLVLFGVNLGELGRRDATHYGSDTLATLVGQVEDWAAERGLVADCRQTDSLERFVQALHEARTSAAAVIVNPGAWTHHERALHDALEPLALPRVEVHLSDVSSREQWRRESVIAPVVDHVVSGKGAAGYREALDWIAAELGDRAGTGG